MNLIWFSIGAAVGAPLRFWLDNIFRPYYKFPYGILIANLLGTLVIGYYAKDLTFLMLGFCGALTTWSTFIVDIYSAIENRKFKLASANLLVSLFLGVIAFKLGNSLN